MVSCHQLEQMGAQRETVIRYELVKEPDSLVCIPNLSLVLVEVSQQFFLFFVIWPGMKTAAFAQLKHRGLNKGAVSASRSRAIT